MNIDRFIAPTEQQQADRRAALIARARAVAEHGWPDDLHTHQRGGVAAVAFLLGDQRMLDEFGETRVSVLSRYAYELYGPLGARPDVIAGWPRHRGLLPRRGRRTVQHPDPRAFCARLAAPDRPTVVLLSAVYQRVRSGAVAAVERGELVVVFGG